MTATATARRHMDTYGAGRYPYAILVNDSGYVVSLCRRLGRWTQENAPIDDLGDKALAKGIDPTGYRVFYVNCAEHCRRFQTGPIDDDHPTIRIYPRSKGRGGWVPYGEA